ncbi:MAG: hypothetical protein OXN89_05995 [Bryobacterales bacterium]|nr:hypothetical protein [Bryobacterales bacterium]
MIDDDGATTAVLVLTIEPTRDGAVGLRWSGPQDKGTDHEVGYRIEVSADGGGAGRSI